MKHFDEVVQNSIEDLFKIAYTYVKNAHIAEDIVQDVLLKAYEKQEQFRGEAHYKTYLTRMTINRSKDVLKSWAYRNFQLTNVFSHLWSPSTTEDTVIQKGENEQLAIMVLALSPKYREVIYFYYYADFSVVDIAQLLQLSENTVKTRLARARKQLQQHVKGEILDGKTNEKKL